MPNFLIAGWHASRCYRFGHTTATLRATSFPSRLGRPLGCGFAGGYDMPLVGAALQTSVGHGSALRLLTPGRVARLTKEACRLAQHHAPGYGHPDDKRGSPDSGMQDWRVVSEGYSAEEGGGDMKARL